MAVIFIVWASTNGSQSRFRTSLRRPRHAREACLSGLTLMGPRQCSQFLPFQRDGQETAPLGGVG
jgi:hypothetical protein